MYAAIAFAAIKMVLLIP